MASNAAFRFRNEFGAIQIDRNYRNLFLLHKIKIDNFQQADQMDRVYDQAEVTFTSHSPPFVAVSATEHGSSITGLLKDGDNYTAIVITNREGIEDEQFLYVFATLAGEPSKRGLIIRNEDNEIVFDAGKKPLRIVRNYRGPHYSPTTGLLIDHSIDIDPERKYAGFPSLRFWDKVTQGFTASGWDYDEATGWIDLYDSGGTTGFSISGNELNAAKIIEQPYPQFYDLYFLSGEYQPLLSSPSPNILIDPTWWREFVKSEFNPIIYEQFESGNAIAYTIIDVTHY